MVAVCSARNADLARSLGADEVLDYTTVDVTAPDRAWDVFFDAFGQAGFSRAARALAAQGVYVTTLPGPETMLRAPFFSGRIFSSYEVGVWKPDPGLFLHAAGALGVRPSDCIVVEDSGPGIAAGLAAGMNRGGAPGGDLGGARSGRRSRRAQPLGASRHRLERRTA